MMDLSTSIGGTEQPQHASQTTTVMINSNQTSRNKVSPVQNGDHVGTRSDNSEVNGTSSQRNRGTNKETSALISGKTIQHGYMAGNGAVTNGHVPHSSLSVCHVSYEVKEWVGPWWKGACFRKIREKQVLDDISMQLQSGEVTAILGNSGSGKTSLLDVITCRTKGKLTGEVFYNDTKCDHDIIQQHAAYVMQADRLLPNLTVRETLTYTACLKLPRGTSAAQIEAKVKAVIMEMGLKDVADSRIGSSIIRGISGGEQRRVTIAIQLLKNPDMVLLDEPTSGLDSHTARYLVSNLRQLARRGKIVLLTIHQPSSDIFQFFDQVALMSVGQLVYCGPARDLVPYFTQLGYPCDKYTNPLDRYVDVASIDRRDRKRERESQARVDKLVQQFRDSDTHRRTVEALLERSQRYWDTRPPPGGHERGPGTWRVFDTVLRRMYKNLFRDRKDYVARVLLLPLFIVFILLFLGRLGHEQSSLQDRIGLLYQSATVPPFMGMINCIALYPCLRNLYYRESRDGLYGAVTFLAAYTAHVLPFHVAASAIFSAVVYWVTGLQADVARFGLYTLTVLLLHYWGEMLTVACLGLFLNPNSANSVTALLMSTQVFIGSGFLKNIHSLVKPLQWLSWILIYKFIGEIFISNEFQGLELDCPVNQTAACFTRGDQYLDRYYPGAPDHMIRNFAAVGAYDIVTLVFAIAVYKLVGSKTLH